MAVEFPILFMPKNHARLFLPVAGLIIVGTLLFAWLDYNAHRQQKLAAATAEVGRYNVALSQRLDSVVQDVLFLAGSAQLVAAMETNDPHAVRYITNEWKRFSDVRQVYDQIRWIDDSGMERIRVNWSEKGAYGVSAAELQNKKGRYYFDDALQREKGHVSISPLDLNIERDTIEQPLKPMIRVGTPVFDSQGARRGVVIINFRAKDMLDLLHQGPLRLWLVNDQGYWLKGETPEDEWGFMHARADLSMASRFPAAWNAIRNGVSGTHTDDSGLWSFATIDPVSHANRKHAALGDSERFVVGAWKLVRFEPQNTLRQAVIERLPVNLGAAFVLLVLAFVITQRTVRAQAAEKLANERMRNTQFAMDRVGIGIAWNDSSNGRFLYANVEACRQLGYSLQSLLALTVSDINPEFSIAAVRDLAARLRSSREPMTLETQHRRKDGSLFPVEVRTYLHEMGGEDIFIVFMHDISDRKLTEHALHEAKTAAEAAKRAKSAFLATMSHELRTPMNGIMGMTDLALRRATDAKQIDHLGKVKTASAHLLSLINDVLDISKLEAERLQLEDTEFNVDGILQNLGRQFDHKAAEKGLKLLIEPQDGLALKCFRGDAGRLEQILINLTDNAIKFSERGIITLRCRLIEDTPRDVLLRWEIADPGIGISPEDQKNLFTPFEQADSSMTRKYGGSGLGLAISRGLARMMRGEIGVESVVGQGSTFWFTVRLDKATSGV